MKELRFILVILLLLVVGFPPISVRKPKPLLSNSITKTVEAPPAISKIFDANVQKWSGKIIEWAEIYELDLNIIATIMQVESCGDQYAVSPAGAMGLFQVMPFHFMDGEDPFDPDTNAMRGMLFLKRQLEYTNGNLSLAFAGYNGGYRASGSSWDSWAHETQRYYVWTTGMYADAQSDDFTTINEWMDAGGWGLCQ